jgi:threonine synthase
VQLVCTACAATYADYELCHPCRECGEPVEVLYAPGQLQPAAALAGGNRSHGVLSDFAAVLPDIGPELISLGEGATPMLELPHLAERLGLPQLHIKNEGVNPTGSFKDRGTAVAISWALNRGFAYLGTVSSGNMAGSVAAYAARAARPCLVFVPAHLKSEKLFTIGVYGPDLLAVDGDYGELYHAALALGRERGIYFAVSDDPWRIEGQKTIAYEIVRDLGRAPDYVFLATSSGGHLAAIHKGFRELAGAGLIDRLPHLVGVQATGCSPIARAFRQGLPVERFAPVNTGAHAISNPMPPSGNRVIRELTRDGTGAIIDVDDEDMLRAQRLLTAGEGVFVQMESAAALAGAILYAHDGRLQPTDQVVLIGTGTGLKDPGAFAGQSFNRQLIELAELSSTGLPTPKEG